jgi:hypothetical protein
MVYPKAFTVRGYASNKHPGWPTVKLGDLLLETTHGSKASKDIEVAAWKARMQRGEVAYVEVISHVEPYGTETIFPEGEQNRTKPEVVRCPGCYQEFQADDFTKMLPDISDIKGTGSKRKWHIKCHQRAFYKSVGG